MCPKHTCVHVYPKQMHRDIFGQSIHQIETIYHTAHKDTLIHRVRETPTHRYHTHIDLDHREAT